ncbi:heterokaryon incompatibility protein-domain-containing protein [Podospora didyma]|uniref:Heterokaryon incompatibility protein-domain-containing protein n=1 Tax=Podospora didyma TaxID=330526 RepID=A0AAE0U3K1_9PEZI|nr:heterokaryon incompatibility protein-domain-containing protein [Podospora didyma]
MSDIECRTSTLYVGMELTSDTDIRLLTLCPIARSDGMVECKLDRYSLDRLTLAYQEFLLSTSNIASLSKRGAATKWTESRMPAALRTEHTSRLHATQPPERLHRYQWGDYAALSYVWGDDTDTTTILVNNCPTEVTSNLAHALRVFCNNGEFGTDSSFKLWVDALCINQKDLTERARQLGRMRNIYGSAWVVVAWLGRESFRSSAAIRLVGDLADFSRRVVEGGERVGYDLAAWLAAEPDYLGTGCWHALRNLMDRHYWFRLWIIQEVIMGASATWIRCGGASIDWTSFCAGIAFLEEYLWLVKNKLLQHEMKGLRLWQRPQWNVGSCHLIYLDLSVLSAREENKVGEFPTFGRLLDIANSAGCKDPRDKVYAMVGLMEPPIAMEIKPDYTLPVSIVYASTARAFMDAYGNLDPIREGNPWGGSGAPSWAADWQWPGRLRWSRTESRLWGPVELSSTLGSSVHVPYRAGGDTKHDAVFSACGTLLTCSGFIVDSIAGLCAFGRGYFKWDVESIAQTPANWVNAYGDVDALRRALASALLMDRVAGGQKPTDSHHTAILHLPASFTAAEGQFLQRKWSWLAGQEGYYFRWESFRRFHRDFGLGGGRMGTRLDDFFTDEIPPEVPERHMTEVYSCFDRTSQKRRFMTTTNGRVGWAPDNIYGMADQQTLAGDKIAVLFGCSTPIVIRPCADGKFQVIGEAYVQGLMDGEGMVLLERGEVKTRSFTFC